MIEMCWLFAKGMAQMALFMIFLFAMLFSIAQAGNLGVQGTVYEIAEPDMLTGIQEKLTHMEESGELKRQQEDIQKRSIQHMLRPQPVSGVRALYPGESPMTRTFNPSILINQDIINSRGEVIARKGQSVNPFNHIGFDENLLFIDADQADQIQWVKKTIEEGEKDGRPYKVILVNGDIQEASKLLHKRVFFDQRGFLCKHFGVKHVPTMIYRPGDEKRLIIEEIRLG